MYYLFFLLIIILIILLLISLCVYLIIFQKKFYRWYCIHFFNFDKYLNDFEKDYINFCINISFLEILRILYFNDQLSNKLSFFTYSHSIENKNINSGRLSYGSTILDKYLYQKAKPILKLRNIKLPLLLNNNLKFYGLGWDFGKETFRIYLRFYNFNLLSKKYQKLSYQQYNLLNTGLIAWTYNKNNKLIETKIYRYPKDILSEEGSHNMVVLSSDMRKYVRQYDINHKDKIWKKRINNSGKNIIKIYEKDGYYVDTIAYHNKNRYTLYFPKLS